MYHNIRSYFKGKDVPNVELSFQEQYEEIRRNLLDLSVPKSLYGPTSFDEHRRNIGRGSAGLQWQLTSNSIVQATTSTTLRVEMLLVAPIDQASASVVYPTPVAQVCRAGEFMNRTRLASDPSLLVNKCDRCPVDSISTENNIDVACQVCVSGTSTEGADGAVICIEHEENLITAPLKGFGYALISLVFFTALGCIGWTFYQRDNPVVRLSQPVFLVLIAVGSIISSSSIIPLSIDAGAFEDETSSNRACMALPWIYTTGWMLQYGCISFKSYRMYVLLKAQKQLKRVAIKTERMLVYVGLLMLLNMVVLIPWTILDPLVWHRTEQGTSIDSQNGVLTFESYGSCSCDNFFLWTGPLLGLQFAVMIFTNFMLWKIRNVSDRYQESRYFIMASLYIFEIIVVGIPILVAVGDSVEASYIVLVCIVGLSDLGTLLMIFVPKIMFARQGLPEGLSVGESLFGVRRQSSVAIDNIRKKALASGSLYLQSRSFDVDDDGFDQTTPSNSRVHQECSTTPSPMPEPMSSDAGTQESSNVANSSKQTKKDSQDESASDYQEE